MRTLDLGQMSGEEISKRVNYRMRGGSYESTNLV